MRNVNRFGTALVLGASIALGACGGDRDKANSTTASGGDVNTPAGATAGSMGATDSSAATSAPGANAAGANTADLANMKAEDQMALIGASNAGEIATSKAAEPKLTNSAAKAYARDMIADHRTMQGQADALAKKLNLTPGSPDQATQKTNMANQMAQQLASATKGADLDRQYIDGQVQAHQQTLNELQGMQNTSNADVKALVDKAIPKVQAHLERAQKIQSQLGGAGAATGTMGGDSAHRAAGSKRP